ncbi:1D-myo-inositol 2-acetamido-2-deoxy-alpha-D-glucopyranoside deacetylase [Streptomyces antimycoticus]
MPFPSLLAVFAHPDDESLSAGGVLAQHAAAGARTAVVTATWAEDTQRAAELADALRILGAGAPRMLGYADARAPQSAPGSVRFCDAPLDESVCRLVMQGRSTVRRPGHQAVSHGATGVTQRSRRFGRRRSGRAHRTHLRQLAPQAMTRPRGMMRLGWARTELSRVGSVS